MYPSGQVHLYDPGVLTQVPIGPHSVGFLLHSLISVTTNKTTVKYILKSNSTICFQYKSHNVTIDVCIQKVNNYYPIWKTNISYRILTLTLFPVQRVPVGTGTFVRPGRVDTSANWATEFFVFRTFVDICNHEQDNSIIILKFK